MNKQDILDIKACAFEGGINYWANISKTPRSSRDTGLNYIGDWKITERDDFGPDERNDKSTTYVLTDAKLRKGIIAAAKAKKQSLASFIENHDAGDADLAVQFALFDKLVYG